MVFDICKTFCEIITSKGSENSFYYTYSTLAQVISGIYAVIGTITLFRLQSLNEIRDNNIGNFKRIIMNDKERNPFIGQEDGIIINTKFNMESIREVVLKRRKFWEEQKISPIETFKVVDANLDLVHEIFNQIDLTLTTLHKLTISVIYNIIWCLISLSLTEFIIINKPWFSIHVVLTLCLNYYFLKFLKRQYHRTFGFELKYFMLF